MDKKVNFYFAALLGTMSPLCAVPALASQSLIATATQQQNSPVLVMSSTLLVSLSLALPLELMDR